MEDSYDYLMKVLLIGESSVGKTSVLLRYTDQVFTPSFQATIGVDFRLATIEKQGKTLKLQLWDTAGQDRYRRIVSSYYRGASGIILVYDITNRDSFEKVQFWLSQCPVTECAKILVANKNDLQKDRKVSTEEGLELAQRLGMDFVETSAKENRCIDEVFETLAKNMLKNKVKALSGNGSLVIGRPKKREGTQWCCLN